MPGPAQRFLPYGCQHIEPDDIQAVVEVLKGPLLTTGPAIERFETAFAETCGAEGAVACANGTAALHLAMLVLEIGPEHAIIVPSITFMATANAGRLVGCEVVFADVDPDTGLMTAENLEEAFTRATRPVRCVVPVHLAGQTADLKSIAEIAERRGAVVVEDASHALGTSSASGETVGNCRQSLMTTFSFHPVKTITAGEGGMLTTNDAALAQRLRRLRSHGIVREPECFVNRILAENPRGGINAWYHELQMLGLNYRLSDIHAALGLSQLTKLAKFKSIRSRLMAAYDGLLAPLAPVVKPLSRVNGMDPCWHLCIVLINFDAMGKDRDAFMGALRALGIGSQVHYIPLHLQPYYRSLYGDVSLPGAQRYYARCLSIPLFVGMTDGDVERVANAVTTLVGERLR